MNTRALERAVIIDINLVGKVDGWQVAKEARQIDPEFPVIYMTGNHLRQRKF